MIPSMRSRPPIARCTSTSAPPSTPNPREWLCPTLGPTGRPAGQRRGGRHQGEERIMGMLEGRVAICTGGARGVGAEVAKLMAAHGARIVVVDPGVGGAGEGGDQRPAQVTVDEIKEAGG